MATPWETKLQRFQQSLVTAKQMIDTDFHYGVIQVRCDGPLPAPDPCPRFYASDGPIVECFALQTFNGLHQFHYVFADYHASDCTQKFNHFKSQLRDVHDILAIVPDRVITASAIPPMPNRLDENFIRWGLLLLWLGGHENNVFHSEIEFAMTASTFETNGRVQPWDEFSTVPGFDPLSLLTLTNKAERGWGFWNKQHANAGRQFPEVLAASLTKPLFYSSIIAVDLILQRGTVGKAPTKVRAQGRVLRDKSEMTSGEAQLLATMMRRHGTRSDAPNFTPITQVEFAAELMVSQETVGRWLKKLLDRVDFCLGQETAIRYKNMCKEGLINGILEHIDCPKTREEITNCDFENM